MQSFAIKLTPTQLQELFSSIDKDNNGTIDFNEFVHGVAAPDYNEKDNIMKFVADRADKETAELRAWLRPRPKSWRRSRGSRRNSGGVLLPTKPVNSC